MANEQQTNFTTGSTVYALIRNTNALIWNNSTSAFESYLSANVPDYAITMTENGTGSGWYVGNFPTGIDTPGIFYIEFFDQFGATPANTDTYIAGGQLDWSGSSVLSFFLPNVTSLANVKLAMNIFNDNSDSQISQFLAAASAAISQYCNRIFTVGMYSEYYDGPGDRTLLLRQRPIVQLTSITVDPFGSDPITVDGSNFIVNTNTGLIGWKPQNQYGSWFVKGYDGQQNYLVVYQAGYQVVPSDIQQVACQICSNLYNWAGQDTSLKQERIGGTTGYTAMYGSDSGKLITSVMEKTLNTYKRYII